MLPFKALPYHLKVRDYLKSETSVWESYSMGSDDEWEITNRIIDAIFERNDEDSGFWQMARIYRLYTGIACDRAAGKVLVDREDAEFRIRRYALGLWGVFGEAAEPAIIDLVEGQQELGSLDVFSRERIRELTRELIRAFLRPAWMRTAPVVVLALDYFPYLTWPEKDDTSDEEDQLPSMEREHGSIQDYFALTLADFVLADPLLGDRSVDRAKTFAARLGIAESFAIMYKYHGKPNQPPL